ncbi:MAG: bifunctional heptose 7-phosphate kinase/heptose 1-phosphate adenyltransferase [Pirellulales bacterium]
MITLERLQATLARFAGLSIGLVGDLFLDRYLDIDPELHELSIETGLEAYQVTQIRNNPGALGTIINNLAALGVGRMVPVTVIGDDGQAYDLLQALGQLPVDTTHILKDARRKTPTYTKPMRRDADGQWRELNRLDLRNRMPLADDTERELLARVSAAFEATDGLIVLDQVNEEGWGVVTPAVRQRLAELCAARPDKLVFVDSRAHIHRFRAGVLKPNRSECVRAAATWNSEQQAPADAADLSAVQQAAEALAAQTTRPLFCTLAEQGILVVETGRPTVRVPALAPEGPIDPVGAGDSVTAGMVASLLSGATPVEAAAVGNLVASITIRQLGTTGTASPADVLAAWPRLAAG